MAKGDLAATAGLEVFDVTSDARNTYEALNVRGDETAAHILNGGHAWDKITKKPATFPPAAHTHDERYYTEAEVTALIASLRAYLEDYAEERAQLAAKAVETTTVQLLNGANGRLGLRFEGGHPVLRLGNGTEYQIALTSDL